MDAHLSIFTRLPKPGESKTRLISELGAMGAAELQRAMTEHVVRQARFLTATDGVRVEVRITGGPPREASRWLGVPCTAQGDGSLGPRLERALAAGLERSAMTAVLGGDCPTVDAADIRTALVAEEACGAAMIPAADGGFCLLALRRTTAPSLGGLLDGIEWGTERVAEQTLSALRHAGVAVHVLPARSDVDTAEDLPAWESVRSAWYDPPKTLGVVVPVLNEAANLPRLLDVLLAEGVEVVVADGGSTDGSAELARAEGAAVVEGARGRGAQLNAGAEAARSDALLFLHADSLPESGFAAAALEALADARMLVGAFRFALDARSPMLAVLEAGTRLRGTALHFPYGDQGLFCRRAAWRALGGFPETKAMEDYAFVARARRAGLVRVIDRPLVTSARRWQEIGPLRWTALNLATVMRYHMGTSPDEIAEWRARHSNR